VVACAEWQLAHAEAVACGGCCTTPEMQKQNKRPDKPASALRIRKLYRPAFREIEAQ
jgi:hypothetical protein